MNRTNSIRATDDNFELIANRWLDEVESDLSDVEDQQMSEDFAIESDHVSSTEQEYTTDEENDLPPVAEPQDSDSSSDTEDSNQGSTSKFYYGKNRYKWAKECANIKIRARKENLIRHLPGLRAHAKQLGNKPEPVEVWNLLFSDELLNEILTWSNAQISSYRQRYANADKIELRPLDMIELRAYIGLLLFSSIYKSSHEKTRSMFATNGKGRDVFRCTMSETRYAIISACLRFDDKNTRQARKVNNPSAACSHIFQLFVENSQKCYTIGENTCVDEMLVGFRGRCHFKVYMPNKPNKYGLKIMVLTDARNSYFYNGYIYCGKGSDGDTLSQEERKLSVPAQSVIRLTKPIIDSGRNITADNWFSSLELVDELLRRKLTFVGTLRRNKKEIPPEFQPDRKRSVGTSLYGFTRNITLLSQVPKKGKAVIMVSSLQHDATDEENGKPEIISFYNCTKGGVDTLDQLCSTYSASRKANRWPMCIFYGLVNISSVNSYVLHQAYQDSSKIQRFDFIDLLATQLTESHIRRRYDNRSLRKELQFTIRKVLGIQEQEMDHPRDANAVPERSKRKRCYLCPSGKDRKTQTTCEKCRKPICLQCANKVCKNCLD